MVLQEEFQNYQNAGDVLFQDGPIDQDVVNIHNNLTHNLTPKHVPETSFPNAWNTDRALASP
jgi:hypothetical protein